MFHSFGSGADGNVALTVRFFWRERPPLVRGWMRLALVADTNATWHVTHDEHHGPVRRSRHAHRAHSLRQRANTRGRVRGGIFSSGRRRRCLVGGAGAFRTFRNYLECPAQRAENQGRDFAPR